MELLKKAASGLVWSSVQAWGGRSISFIVFAILCRLLTPEAFGLVAMASVFIFFVQVFEDQGFGDAIIQRDKLSAEHLDTAFWTNLLTCALLTLTGVTAAGLVGALFHEQRLIPIIRCLSLNFLFAGLGSIQQAILRRQFAFRQLAIRSLLASTAGGMIGVLMAFLGFGVWSLVAQSLTNSAVGVIVLWTVTPWRPVFRFSKTLFKELLSFGANIVGINFLNFLNRHADDLLIGYFLGPTLLGFYTVAYRLLVTMTGLLAGVANAVALPTFARLQNDPERMRRAFCQALHYVSLIAFPAFIGVAVLSTEVIITFFGPTWTASIPVMRILAFIGLLHSCFYLHHSLVIALGKPSWRLGITFINAVSNVIAFLLAVRWGIVAVAAAYVIRGYLLAPMEIWIIRKLTKVGVKLYSRQLIGPLASSLAMTGVVAGLRLVLHDTLAIQLQLAMYLFGGVVTYLFTMRLIEPSLWPRLLMLYRDRVGVASID